MFHNEGQFFISFFFTMHNYIEVLLGNVYNLLNPFCITKW